MFKSLTNLITTPIQMLVDIVMPPANPVSPEGMTTIGRILRAPTGNIEEHLYLSDAIKKMDAQALLSGLAASTTTREAQVYKTALGWKVKLDVLKRDDTLYEQIELYAKMVIELYHWDRQGQPLPAPRWLRRLTERVTGIELTPIFKTRVIANSRPFYWNTIDDPTSDGDVYVNVKYAHNPPIALSTEILKYK